MSCLLVTGGAGFIGANFINYWMTQYPADRVIALDALTYAGNIQNLSFVKDNENFRFVHGDIKDTELVESLLRSEAVDTLVHFAAESHVDRSITGPDEFLETNIIGTHSLLKAARKVWLSEKCNIDNHRFHHVSTDEVYGELTPDEPAFTEKTPYAPNSPYSASKAASDFLVRAYHHTYGLKVTTSNCSNNYGPYQFPEKLIPLVLLNILHGRTLPVYGDGTNVRDWLHVDDHAYGIELVIKQGRLGETYNIGGVNEWTNIDIVNLICQLLNERFEADPNLQSRFPESPASQGKENKSLITYVTDRPGHDFRYAIDTTLIKYEMGYEPRFTFEEGIRNTIDWYLGNEDWWQAVMDGSYQQWIDTNYKQMSR